MDDNNLTFHFYPQSLVYYEDITYYLLKSSTGEKYLGIKGDHSEFHQYQPTDPENGLCPVNEQNAAVLRHRLPWLNASSIGLRPSFGTGDRLGLATPGHARALVNKPISPIFAQQSVRENTRTRRSPQQVMDDAMWGLFQEGWRNSWGADADHIKEINQVQPFIDAGYSFFTADPGDYINSVVKNHSPVELFQQFRDLPWGQLEISPEGLLLNYQGQSFTTGNLVLSYDRDLIIYLAVKFGKALAYIASLYRYIADRKTRDPFDFEVSVDETNSPTTPHEHFFITRELQRMGVHFVSLAPRFVGSFEKGVDFIGSLDEFSEHLSNHVEIANHFGFYKISLHSGSDKFSTYPILNRLTKGLFHVKTAGTSYLEALRMISHLSPSFFRDILAASLERFPTDQVSYHISAEIDHVPQYKSLPDTDLPDLLNQFDTRQILHVCFGSILDRYGSEIKTLLNADEENYYDDLQSHFEHHLMALIVA